MKADRCRTSFTQPRSSADNEEEEKEEDKEDEEEEKKERRVRTCLWLLRLREGGVLCEDKCS